MSEKFKNKLKMIAQTDNVEGIITNITVGALIQKIEDFKLNDIIEINFNEAYVGNIYGMKVFIDNDMSATENAIDIRYKK